MKASKLFISLLCTCACLQKLSADSSVNLAERLQQTRAVNIDTIIETQFNDADRAVEFTVADPYASDAAKTVNNWITSGGLTSGVCAFRFTNEQQVDYELHDFVSAMAANANGFTVTHQGRCGSCSTLKDLSVYLATPDLTTPARRCARRFGLSGKKQCFEEQIGFTPYCAESWAYNAHETKKMCLGVCVRDYGFFNLLFHHYPGDNVTESGQLRPCLQCDEDKSGPGFKYSAGRTRRNSGVESTITRSGSELYPMDHSGYFHKNQ